MDLGAFTANVMHGVFLTYFAVSQVADCIGVLGFGGYLLTRMFSNLLITIAIQVTDLNICRGSQ